MNVQLQKADLERFVQDQVNSGNFASPEAVIEASLTRMMEEEVALTAEDLADIQMSQSQFDRGQTVEFDEFSARMRKKFGLS